MFKAEKDSEMEGWLNVYKWAGEYRGDGRGSHYKCLQEALGSELYRQRLLRKLRKHLKRSKSGLCKPERAPCAYVYFERFLGRVYRNTVALHCLSLCKWCSQWTFERHTSLALMVSHLCT